MSPSCLLQTSCENNENPSPMQIIHIYDVSISHFKHNIIYSPPLPLPCHQTANKILLYLVTSTSGSAARVTLQFLQCPAAGWKKLSWTCCIEQTSSRAPEVIALWWLPAVCRSKESSGCSANNATRTCEFSSMRRRNHRWTSRV